MTKTKAKLWLVAASVCFSSIAIADSTTSNSTSPNENNGLVSSLLSLASSNVRLHSAIRIREDIRSTLGQIYDQNESTLNDAAPNFIRQFKQLNRIEEVELPKAADLSLLCSGPDLSTRHPETNYQYMNSLRENGGLTGLGLIDENASPNKQALLANPYSYINEKNPDIYSLWIQVFQLNYGITYAQTAIETINALVDGSLTLEPEDQKTLLSGYAGETEDMMMGIRFMQGAEGTACKDFGTSLSIRYLLRDVVKGKTSLDKEHDRLSNLIGKIEQEYLQIQKTYLPLDLACNDVQTDQIFDDVMALEAKNALYASDNNNISEWNLELVRFAIPTNAMQMILDDMVLGEFPRDTEFGIALLIQLLEQAARDQSYMKSRINTYRQQSCEQP